MQKKEEGKGLAIASLCLGIVSIVLFFTIIIGILGGIVAVTLGIIVLAKKKNGKGLAIAGIMTGAIGLLLTALAFLLVSSLSLWAFMRPALVNPESDSSNINLLKTQIDLEYVKTMVESYKKTEGFYPTTIAELQNDEFLEQYDQYGQEFYYKVNPDGKNYTLKSAGPDRELGTFDDIIV